MPYSQHLKIIKNAVATKKVRFSEHASKRMVQRKITFDMVMLALKRGTISRPPEPNIYGAVEVELNRYCAGVNYSVVVAVVDGEIVVTVVTVY